MLHHSFNVPLSHRIGSGIEETKYVSHQLNMASEAADAIKKLQGIFTLEPEACDCC